MAIWVAGTMFKDLGHSDGEITMSTASVCVDGVYITTLDKERQASWIGWQGAFWNAGRIFATALVVGAAGWLQKSGHDPKTAWAIALSISVATMAGLGIYHYFMLPQGSVSVRPESGKDLFRTFGNHQRKCSSASATGRQT